VKTKVNLLWIVAFLFGMPALFFSCNNNDSNSKEKNDLISNEGKIHLHDQQSIVLDYEPEDRLIWQKPDLVINLLGNLKDKTVADIGAGTGFFSFRMAKYAHKVIATDIDQVAIGFMDSLRQTYPENMLDKVELRLVKESEHGLQIGEVDAVLLVNTYMYIENRIDYLKSLKPVLKENPIILIIDFKRKNMPIGPPVEAKIDLSVVEEELKAAGYQILYSDDTTLDYQYIIKATL